MKKDDKNMLQMPLVALRGLNVFPNMILHFDVARPKSIRALEEAMISDQSIFLVAQKDAETEEPESKDLYNVGTISSIKQILKLPTNTIRVLVEGNKRGKIVSFEQEDPYFLVNVEEYDHEEDPIDVNKQALIRAGAEIFEEYAKVNNRISSDTIRNIVSMEKPGEMADAIASNIQLRLEDKQKILSAFDEEERLLMVIKILKSEIEILNVQKDILDKVKKNIDQSQKEYYLREQLKIIQNELGDRDGIQGEINEYREKLNEIDPPQEVREKVEKELQRMLKIPAASAESVVVRNYIDWILDLPWTKETKESHNIKYAKKILEKDHYGLEKVKERILEFLSIREMSPKVNSPIICLVGPPGVGKTSIAHSIAKALNRNYVRISLGGVRDEAEIRGHRRTYVGALPGRIIQGLKQAKSKNPLMLLDEIDKMSSDFRGDPSAALLEVLDAEQNHAFRDHFIELPFDLSNVLFLATANTLDTIPRPLLDRMEVIQISSYTEEEKFHIAYNHLIDKQLEKHGMTRSQLRISREVIKNIITYYTKEAGVRKLERCIGELCRKAAKEILEEDKKCVRITESNLEKYLGVKKYRINKIMEQAEIGIARGLAWTPVGGDTLSIEVNTMKGTGKFELTGQLGDVMKESAKAAISYIRSRAESLGIDSNFYKDMDIHIHIPEGAVPKDGPSAGITMATAMISALTNQPVRNDVGMTGEITLRGRVLPIGGLKEKILAAKAAGIKTVILPIDNEKDLNELSNSIKENMEFVLVKNMEEVLNHAIIKENLYECK
ncbi:MAG: ATP-dependent Lon protease [Epulopiscium sp.]|jgi:ATP-dependent Lon protease|uniref:Lon protease n=1 Tax=Defluviitalea raffinosedens TaxID=1450156 RepID=A0A7C8HEI9_9FIRM|nr:endopeptidase La [Defluviitalea raffinosedens]KAE9634398.1 endopeptidase La [Defluviitalea raffinosedens]MBM7684812.1 ATP-dependent Lon protease [Defluviitalea raffinosedens]MBZ4668288.1 ATP-dependent protease La [Defluviitaleaceae bacterium]MDK2787474.1 ATP-dependent Lon protease [Candidatus Epulonipiscium sp.]